MYPNNKFINKNEFTYDELKKIEDHAKQYDLVSDKKTFLKEITPYEQKIVLLESKNPYEVLMYLDELDMKNSRLVLNNLETYEIINIINMFTSEDKKNFYTKFSDLELVNQFIVYDKNASSHIEDLNIERKIELLNNSDEHTLEATSKVYDSLQEEEKLEVVQSITSAEGSLALSEATDYKEEQQEIKVQDQEIKNELNEIEKNQLEKEEEIKNQDQEQKEEVQKLEIKEEEKESIMNEFLLSRIEYYKNIIPELKDMANISFALLSEDIKQGILMDYEKSKLNQEKKPKEIQEEQKSLEQDITSKSEEFHNAATVCEQELINSLLENFKENTDENEEKKTL